LSPAELRAAVEDGDLKNEQISDQLATQLLNERAGGSSRAAWEIVSVNVTL